MGGQARMPSIRSFATKPVGRLLRVSGAVGKKAEMVMANQYDRGIGDSQMEKDREKTADHEIFIGLQCFFGGNFANLRF